MYAIHSIITISINITTMLIYHTWTGRKQLRVDFMYGFCYNFGSLRFKQSQNLNDLSAVHVVVLFASSEVMTCRLLK